MVNIAYIIYNLPTYMLGMCTMAEYGLCLINHLIVGLKIKQSKMSIFQIHSTWHLPKVCILLGTNDMSEATFNKELGVQFCILLSFFPLKIM